MDHRIYSGEIEDSMTLKTPYSGTDIRVYAFPVMEVARKSAIQQQALTQLKQTAQDATPTHNVTSPSTLYPIPANNINITTPMEIVARPHDPHHYGDSIFFELGSLAEISYSTFREKVAVRNLGMSSANVYTRGARTIAGTMVFTVFNTFELDRLRSKLNDMNIDGLYYPDTTITLMDQLPPINLLLHFANEYGSQSVMYLFDVEFQSEGQNNSINQVTVDRTFNYYCREFLPLTPISNTFKNEAEMWTGEEGIAGKIISPSKASAKSSNLTTFNDLVGAANDDSSPIQQLLRASRSIMI